MLVEWRDAAEKTKEFLPRLGATIEHIAVSPAGDLLCTSHADNSTSAPWRGRPCRRGAQASARPSSLRLGARRCPSVPFLSPLRPRSAPSRLPRGLRSRGSVCGVRVPLTFQNFPCGVNRVGSGGRAEGPGAVGTCAYGRAGHAGARAALAGTEAVCLFPRRALLMHPEPPPAATSEGRLTRDM